jgi:hypothetical protein
MSVQGLSEIRKAFADYKEVPAKKLRKGLIRAGLFLQRESQKIVPVEFGVLKNSANTRAEESGLDTEVVVSYGTDYAIYVHENLEAGHKSGKQAKYLEQPLREKRNEMRKIVQEAMK